MAKLLKYLYSDDIQQMKELPSSAPADTESLVKSAQQGNQEAFTRLYRQFADQIYRFSYFKTSNRQLAEDITSETFLRVWRYLARYKSQNFRAYLFTIARNLINDHYKNQARTGLMENVDEQLADKPNDPLANLIKSDQNQGLLTALSKLSPLHKEVVMWRFIEELSVKETAAIIKRPSVWVRVVQHRALRKLKQLMEHHE